MANQANIMCIPHGPWSALCIASHLNVLLTLKNGFMIEYPSPFIESRELNEALLWPMHNTVIEKPLKIEDGYLKTPDSPGLGLGNFVPEAIDELKSFMTCTD